MSGEIENQAKEIIKEETIIKKISSIIDVAGKEFPCLTCASRDECGSFKWFTKWFGTKFNCGQE
jgi:hypothetical protein